MNTAMSPVHATMPRAIHEASPAMVRSGLSEFDSALACPEPNPTITPTTSSVTAPIRSHAARLMGPRVSFRSVRYQCPSSRPSKTAPVNAAPASSWKKDTPVDSSVVRANAHSIATARGTVRTPTTRAAGLVAGTASRTSHSKVAPARTSDMSTASPPAEPDTARS